MLLECYSGNRQERPDFHLYNLILRQPQDPRLALTVISINCHIKQELQGLGFSISTQSPSVKRNLPGASALQHSTDGKCGHREKWEAKVKQG